jgi:GTPase SAR1 family protein
MSARDVITAEDAPSSVGASVAEAGGGGGGVSAAGGAGGSGSGGSDTVVVLIVGTAGSGKTTLVHRLSLELAMRGDSTYILNLDPAVLHLPYQPNIDIRDTVNYKELMRQYNLGPNGGIVTALNLFATRFDKVSELLQGRAKSTRFILVDTPGQIEVFTWSASGNLITDMLVASFPTVLLYAVDTPRCKSPVTFMSNMLYSCSILYKSRLPFVVAFNKVDVQPHDFAVQWMEHFDAFHAALDEVNLHSDSYINTLTRSLGLALDEFYSTLSHVGVSSITGAGFPALLAAVRSTPLPQTRGLHLSRFPPPLPPRR